MQQTDYYPFGMPLQVATNPERQPFKYSGKEFDTMHGINLYDFHTRQQYPALGIFTSVDPLAEKYPWVSPYAYCLNNPLKYVDPDVKEIRVVFTNMHGNTTGWRFNGSNHAQAPNHRFVASFLAAYDYNVSNGGGEKLQQAATATDYTLNIEYTNEVSEFGTTSYKRGQTDGAVRWNPYMGLETPKGTLSPATILEHETDHGVDWQTNTTNHLKNNNNITGYDPHFGNKEEGRVIMWSEYKTGVANGELKTIPKGQEHIHTNYRKHGKNSGNMHVPVSSPISNEKIIK